jgi:peptidoglycan/LPS O-acetylase OafA/YrhL
MLGEAFDTRPNAFNAVRLVLASVVLVWHVLLMTLPADFATPGWQLPNQGAVDAFFAISGFLIVRSWDRRPDPLAFVRARLGRLLPGLWLCLVVTAFVVVPLAVGRVPLTDQVRYVLGNAGVLMTRHTIGGTPAPRVDSWDISLWTLSWELYCYAVVLVLGVLGMLRTRLVLAVVALCWCLMAAQTLTGLWGYTTFWAYSVPRLGLMFGLGAAAYLLRHRVPVSGRWAAVALAALAVSLLTPNYHLIGAPALAYLVLWSGLELGRWPLLRLSTDLSYGVYVYSSPVLTALLLNGVTSWRLAGLGAVLTFALAAASWHLVERPASAWARGRGGRGADRPRGALGGPPLVARGA